jgi:hypothetical protein
MSNICFTFVQQMSAKVYFLQNKYENYVELLQNFLILYSVSSNLNNPNNHLRPRLSNVLAYYVLNGYSEETKQLILDSKENLTRKHLNQINCELQKQGYLHPHSHNENRRVVDKSLTDLKEYLEQTKDKQPLLLVKFVKEDA